MAAGLCAALLAGCLENSLSTPEDPGNGSPTDTTATIDTTHSIDSVPAPPRDETPVYFFPREGVYEYSLTTLVDFIGTSCVITLDLKRAGYAGAPGGLYRARQASNCKGGGSSVYFVRQIPDGSAVLYDSATGATSPLGRPFPGGSRPAFDTRIQRFAGESVRVWKQATSSFGSSSTLEMVEGFGIVKDYSGYSTGYHGGGSASFQLTRFNGIAFALN